MEAPQRTAIIIFSTVIVAIITLLAVLQITISTTFQENPVTSEPETQGRHRKPTGGLATCTLRKAAAAAAASVEGFQARSFRV